MLIFNFNTKNNVDFPWFLLRLELTIGAKMNKKQLVAKISSTLGQSKADAERTFDSITTIILDALKNDDTVKTVSYTHLTLPTKLTV